MKVRRDFISAICLAALVAPCCYADNQSTSTFVPNNGQPYQAGKPTNGQPNLNMPDWASDPVSTRYKKSNQDRGQDNSIPLNYNNGGARPTFSKQFYTPHTQNNLNGINTGAGSNASTAAGNPNKRYTQVLKVDGSQQGNVDRNNGSNNKLLDRIQTYKGLKQQMAEEWARKSKVKIPDGFIGH